MVAGVSVSIPPQATVPFTATATTLRAVDSDAQQDGQPYVVRSLDSVFVWDAASVAVDDGNSYIRPDDRTSLQAGRWIVTNLGVYSGSGGAALVGFLQSGTGAVARTAQAKLRETVSIFDFMSTAQIAAVMAGTSTNDTALLTLALNSGAKVVQLPAATYRFANVSVPTGVMIQGSGIGRTIVKIVAGATTAVFTATSQARVGIRDLTIDGADADFDDNHGIYFLSCAEVELRNLDIAATGGSGYWGINSRVVADNITIRDIIDQNSWAFHVQGAGAAHSFISNIYGKNCGTRIVMVRQTSYVQVHAVTGYGNKTTPMWFQDANYCLATDIIDHDDEIGDTAVIDGNCTGTWIIGVTARNAGGHCASIASNADSGVNGAPKDCHIVNVYSEEQGECIAAISDQGTGLQIQNCSIRNVHGKNCGMGNGGAPVPSEGFAIYNATGCIISGSVTNTAGNMTYAAKEAAGGGSSANNRFEIDSWVSGSAGYAALFSSSSMILFPKLDGGFVRVGNADFTFVSGTERRRIIYDQAPLTADRTVSLGAGWPNLVVTVCRTSVASGAFSLLVKQGATTLATMSAGRWQRFIHDGSNWNLVEGGNM